MLTEKSHVVNDVSIHYAEGPPNDTPLLMLHGMTGHWEYFVSMMPSLVLRYHLFAPDLRGHGGSSWTPGAYAIPDDVGDIAALLRDRVQKPAVVFGHSYGGIVATALAASAPELVRAVITVDPPLPLLSENGSWLDEIIYPFFQALREIISQDATDLDKMAQLSELQPDLDALALRQQISQYQRFDPERLTWGIDGRVKAGLTLDTLFAGVTCPVLLIQCNPAVGGMLDDETAQRMVALLLDCIHLYRADVGHRIPTTQPAALAKMVTDFLELL